jgi:hypothetical protein
MRPREEPPKHGDVASVLMPPIAYPPGKDLSTYPESLWKVWTFVGVVSGKFWKVLALLRLKDFV